MNCAITYITIQDSIQICRWLIGVTYKVGWKSDLGMGWEGGRDKNTRVSQKGVGEIRSWNGVGGMVGTMSRT